MEGKDEKLRYACHPGPAGRGEKPTLKADLNEIIILVADDQQSQINLMDRQLSRVGYKTIRCSSGEEAIDRLGSQKVDMIITDMEMGGITGEHVLTYVRKRFGLLPVILMSGDPDNLRRKGFDGYLTKPFSIQQLLTAVENARKWNLAS